ncbi:hypothetical protein [Listeria booriae]|uniref:hypothetical protein n=1 Tax=Listeria booriae TaxID=1552123 RepID=UPI001629667C|nr:hypothetical protein [Listeria booriae]MBC1290515.1 hypothetical protein [Listeria booriae]
MSKEVNSNFGYIVKLGNAYLHISDWHSMRGDNISLNLRCARKYDNYDDAKKVADEYGGKVLTLMETETIEVGEA